MRNSLVTLGLILLLTACGDDESDPGQEPDGSPVPDASEGDAAPDDAGPAGARLNTGFGDRGVALVEVLTEARDIHANPDGTILVVGSRDDRPAVCQITAGGVLDGEWGDGGCVLLGTETGGVAHEVTLVGDDYVISVDRPLDPDGVALWRLRRDGSVDTSIGDEGQIALSPATHNFIGGGACVGVTSAGDHLVVGGIGRGVGAFRVSSAGEVVTFLHVSTPLIADVLGAVLTDTGDLLAGGMMEGGSLGPFGWAFRFSADLEQATPLIDSLRPPSYIASVIGSGPGTIVVSTTAVERKAADGTVDPKFQRQDCAGCIFTDMASAGDDRILVHATTTSFTGTDEPQLYILRADGAPDETAASEGRFQLPSEGADSGFYVEGGSLAYANGRAFVLKLQGGQQRITAILLD